MCNAVRHQGAQTCACVTVWWQHGGMSECTSSSWHRWAAVETDQPGCSFTLVRQVRRVRPLPPKEGDVYNDMSYLLLASERRRCQQYELMWLERYGRRAAEDPDAIFHLGDNPTARCCWTGSGLFPSLRRSMGILWHPYSRSMLLPSERLSLLGWPLFQDLATAAGCNIVRTPFEGRGQLRLNAMAGNAYHIPTFGVWAFVVLACLKLDIPAP